MLFRSYVAWGTSDTLRGRVNAFGLMRAPARRDTVTIIARTLTGVRDSTLVTFTPTPTALAGVSGGGQTGGVLAALPLPIRVRVTAADGLGVKGIVVRFTRGTSGGAVTDSLVATDDSGFAQTTIALGPVPSLQVFQASVPGAAFPAVVFSETALSVHAADLTASETWTTATSPHVVTGYLRILNGATLTIEPGAVVKFDAGAGLQVGDTVVGQAGSLVLNGTTAPITLTANTATPAPGFWRGLEVQRTLAVAPWRKTLIEWAGGLRSNPLYEGCVLIANASGAALDLDSLHIRQCAHAGTAHFGGTTHVHRSEIDTVVFSSTPPVGQAGAVGVYANNDARIELDSNVVIGGGGYSFYILSDRVSLAPSSGNRLLGHSAAAIIITAVQLPGLLRQDTLSSPSFIGVGPGRPDSTVAAFTMFHQPGGLSNFYAVASPGLLDIGRVGGQTVTLDSNVRIEFTPQSGLLIGDSSGSRSGMIRSLGTSPGNQPRLRGGSVPGGWLGVEIGRLAGNDTLKHVRIEFAGDSLPGRTGPRAGLWVRSPAPFTLTVDSVQLAHNGKVGAEANAAGLGVTARGAGVSITHTVADSNAGFGFATVVPIRLVDDTASYNTVGLGSFINGGSQITPSDSFARDVFSPGNVYPAEQLIGTQPMFRAGGPITNSGNLRDTILIDGGTLTASGALGSRTFPFRVRKSIAVDSGAVLTINGTVVFDDSASIVVGSSAAAALRAPATSKSPILLTATPGHLGWFGLVFQNLSQPDTLSNVVVEKAGHIIPCPLVDCGPTPIGAIRFANTSGFGLLLDTVTVRNSNAYAVEALPSGTGAVVIRRGQFYANAALFHASSGAVLSVTESDIYHYAKPVVVNNSVANNDSVNATSNWWGDVRGLSVGFPRDTYSLAQASSYQTRFVPFATAPFFPGAIGAPAQIIAVGEDSVQGAFVGNTIDSIRARVVDAGGRGVAAQVVNWTTNTVSVLPSSSTTDVGGRAAAFWTIGVTAETDTARAISGALPPARFLVNLVSAPPALSEFPIATTAADEEGQSAAFDGINYLVGVSGPTTSAQLVSQSGAKVGSLITIPGYSGDPPYVAFDGTNYLVAWAGCAISECTRGQLLGQFVSPADTLVGNVFTVASDTDFNEVEGIAYGSGTYLVSYVRGHADPSLGPRRMFGRLVSPLGTVGSEIAVSSGTAFHGINNVAFDGLNFFVTWADNSVQPITMGRFVDTSGSLIGLEITVNGSPALSDNPVTVAFNGMNYFVLWHDETATPGIFDVMGQAVSPGGALVGQPVDLTTNSGTQIAVSVIGAGNNFMVSYLDAFGTPQAVARAKFFTSSGAVIGQETVLARVGTDSRVPFVTAGGFNSGQFFLIVERQLPGANPLDFNTYTQKDVFGAIAAISP